jgi:hypothetical protein
VVLLGSPADGGQMFLVTRGSFVHMTSAPAMIDYSVQAEHVSGFCWDHPQMADKCFLFTDNCPKYKTCLIGQNIDWKKTFVFGTLSENICFRTKIHRLCLALILTSGLFLSVKGI